MRIIPAIAAVAILASCTPTPTPVVLQHAETKQTVTCDAGGSPNITVVGASSMRQSIQSCVEQYRLAGFEPVGDDDGMSYQRGVEAVQNQPTLSTY